jgi:stage III sporulation protein AG
MIVAEGAEDEQIRYEIMNVVSATFNISKDKVNVVPMKR